MPDDPLPDVHHTAITTNRWLDGKSDWALSTRRALRYLKSPLTLSSAGRDGENTNSQEYCLSEEEGTAEFRSLGLRAIR